MKHFAKILEKISILDVLHGSELISDLLHETCFNKDIS